MSRFHGTRQRKAFDVWQIVYIDLMTNVMIFFVVLWAVQSAPKKSGVSDTFGTETVKMVNLPGDVLFQVGKSDLSDNGRQVFQKLFQDGEGTVLNFDTGGLTKRMLVIHGHTDNDGKKEKNIQLGFDRALATYKEISKYGGGLADHVVICTHADNSPAQDVPAFSGTMSKTEETAINDAKAKNRRIVIEDKLVSRSLEKTP